MAQLPHRRPLNPVQIHSHNDNHNHVHTRRSHRRRGATSGAAGATSAPSSLLLHPQQRISWQDVTKAQPFSWLRCLVSLFSYALLLSDVVRSGFGVDTAALSGFKRLEPDAILHFGPYAYSVTKLSAAAPLEKEDVSVWSYKYDTTSVSMRSIAQQLHTPDWPACVVDAGGCLSSSSAESASSYKSYQHDDKLPRHVVFRMLDSLVASVARTRHGHVAVRTEYDWYDRLHHFAFPWFFQRTVKRTTHATHYRLDPFSSSASTLSLCGRQRQRQRPFLCDDAWTHYRRLCDASSNSYCTSVATSVWAHIETRMATLHAKFPNHTLELALIQGSDDYTRQGIAFQGRKLFDIATVARIRDCHGGSSHTHANCTTVLVDDYRYESACMTLNASTWFGIVAMVRAAGQAYAWLRLVFLLGGTFVALRGSDSETHSGDGFESTTSATVSATTSTWSLVVATLRTAFLIPSQVVIYGSVLPIACYVFAHLLDSTAVYELVALRFNSTLGNFHFEIHEFVRFCAVSMRSLWSLAMACHILLALYTKRFWSPAHGLPGIPEFSISFVASLTILAQLRSTSWRSTRLLQVHEVVASTARHRWQTMAFAIPRTPINKLLLGTAIDAQCLLSSLVLFLLLMLASRVLSRLLPQLISYKMALFSRSLVPYSAGWMWLTNGLVVCWHGAFLVRIPTRVERPLATWRSASLVRGMPFRRLTQINHFAWQASRASSTVALAISDTMASMQLQRDMHSVDKRSREVEAMVFLVNLATMTDPLTFFKLRAFGGRLMGLYESKTTAQRFLLPLGLDAATVDIPIDFDALELRTVTNSKDVAWWELLQCG